jgi:branched-chain amino acid transport system ATP-binding protein
MEHLVETRDIVVTFGGVTAVNEVNLGVSPGSIVGLVGPNGAGKTTLFNVISGLVRPQRGRVYYNGRDITSSPPHVIARLGIARTFQLTSLFDELTVLDNVVVASYVTRTPSLVGAIFRPFADRRGLANARRDSDALLTELNLESIKNAVVSELSHGHRKLLSVAMALASRPSCLLLDEPVSGMKRDEVDRTLQLLADLRARGTTIVLVEHNVRAVIEICDRVVVLNFGRRIAEGPPREILDSDEVRAAYFGVQRPGVAKTLIAEDPQPPQPVDEPLRGINPSESGE